MSNSSRITSLREEVKRLRHIVRAARDLDNAVAEFGVKPEFVSDNFQILHDRLAEYDANAEGATERIE